ncbi:hypothetical protein HMSSN036_25050 [Paenibacillus macerans]|nr:hypothetical protein HMSSN036_25050 [Paenibacillus macerans]
MERGDRNISLETLEKIALALDVPAGELVQSEEALDKQRLLDEHLKLVGGRKAEEIALITKITRDVIWGWR